jgi:MFS transporter, FSR family, fosmidomycin resistance protein
MPETKSAVMEANTQTPARSGGDATRPNLKIIGLLALGHLCVDTNQGAVSAILPFIKSAQGLSYTAAGALVLVMNLTSSVIQPLFGYLADRRSRRWMLPLSVLLAGLGMGLTGWAGNYWTVMLLLIVMGLGIAAYHPEGYRSAASVAGSRKATGISWFSVGGNAGIALGPPMITFLIVRFGLSGSVGMILPALIVSLLLLMASPHLSSDRLTARPTGQVRALEKQRPGAMALLIVVVALRSWMQLGFSTYIPFYYLDYLKASPETVASLLFVFLGAGAVGTLIGGPIADRIGARRFVIWAFLLTVPLGILFLKASGALAFVTLGLFGAVSVATFTTTVVLGQAYLPRNPGMASGLIVGFALGTGGMAVTLLGRIADAYGVPAVLWISALMPILGFIAATFLPSCERREGQQAGRV